MKFRDLLAILLAVTAFSTFAFAKNEDAKKQIDFEGDVVEGVNKQPLDALNQTAEGIESRGRLHLYRRKKTSKAIEAENEENLRELVETF